MGALLSRAYTAGGCILGMTIMIENATSHISPSLMRTGSIFGTGTNGAYVEKVEKITKLGDAPARKRGGDMVVNCEWGAFNNTVCFSRIPNLITY